MCYTGGDAANVRMSLQIKNMIVGYVFLLDPEGRVRWRAHATPTVREIKALLSCSRQLMDST